MSDLFEQKYIDAPSIKEHMQAKEQIAIFRELSEQAQMRAQMSMFMMVFREHSRDPGTLSYQYMQWALREGSKLGSTNIIDISSALLSELHQREQLVKCLTELDPLKQLL